MADNKLRWDYRELTRVERKRTRVTTDDLDVIAATNDTACLKELDVNLHPISNALWSALSGCYQGLSRKEIYERCKGNVIVPEQTDFPIEQKNLMRIEYCPGKNRDVVRTELGVFLNEILNAEYSFFYNAEQADVELQETIARVNLLPNVLGMDTIKSLFSGILLSWQQTKGKNFKGCFKIVTSNPAKKPIVLSDIQCFKEEIIKLATPLLKHGKIPDFEFSIVGGMIIPRLIMVLLNDVNRVLSGQYGICTLGLTLETAYCLGRICDRNDQPFAPAYVEPYIEKSKAFTRTPSELRAEAKRLAIARKKEIMDNKKCAEREANFIVKNEFDPEKDNQFKPYLDIVKKFSPESWKKFLQD